MSWACLLHSERMWIQPHIQNGAEKIKHLLTPFKNYLIITWYNSSMKNQASLSIPYSTIFSGFFTNLASASFGLILIPTHIAFGPTYFYYLLFQVGLTILFFVLAVLSYTHEWWFLFRFTNALYHCRLTLFHNCTHDDDRYSASKTQPTFEAKKRLSVFPCISIYHYHIYPLLCVL